MGGGGDAQKKVFGVFSGGGTKCAALLGAYNEALTKVDFVGWGGTSAGSIIATLLACGYTAEDLKQELGKTPLSEFFKIRKSRLLMLLLSGSYPGVISPKPLKAWLRKLIERKFPEKGHIRFRDLASSQHLKIVAANISRQEIEIYSRKNTPNTEIATAVLASCSFPLLFPPVREGPDEFVDGGLLSNFPMWLFDDERKPGEEFVPVLGFSVISKAKKQKKGWFLAHAYSIWDSLLVAQDRIQEKYMDAVRSSNVIRIQVGNASTFDAEQKNEEQERLILAGRDAAKSYFDAATMHYGERFEMPATPIDCIREKTVTGDDVGVISAIAREHILHGGVARDSGIGGGRQLVKYYLDLMEAVTEHNKLALLAKILAKKIEDVGQFDRIIGLKKGNVLLAYTVARLLKKPISFFKTDMSYKMGLPFDGGLPENTGVIIVDDIASDASIIVNAIQHLNFHRVHVKSVVTLIERREGDARPRINNANSILRSICLVDDLAIENLIAANAPFQIGQGFS